MCIDLFLPSEYWQLRVFVLFLFVLLKKRTKFKQERSEFNEDEEFNFFWGAKLKGELVS